MLLDSQLARQGSCQPDMYSSPIAIIHAAFFHALHFITDFVSDLSVNYRYITDIFRFFL